MSERPAPMPVLGYSDRPSVIPGESLSIHVSCSDPAGYEADLVRLQHGDLAAAGPGMKVHPVPASSIDGHHDGELRRTPAGSFAVLPARSWLPGGAWNVSLRVCPFASPAEREALLHCRDESGAGLLLELVDGRFRAELSGPEGDVVLSAERPVEDRCWYELRVEAGEGAFRLEIAPCGAKAASRLRFRDGTHERLSAPLPGPAEVGVAELWLAAAPDDRPAPFARGHFSGKLEGPLLGGTEGELNVDFSVELAPREPHDRCTATGPGGEVHGILYNLPTRAVTGSEWTGSELDFRSAPEQYEAIHFHSDDLAEAHWPESLRLEIPEDLPSGIYAARLRAGSAVDHVPFVVRPRPDGPKAPIAFLLPTASYLAYANDKFGPDSLLIQLIAGRIPVLQAESLHLHEHRELGSSLYDIHPDGSGVSLSTWRRPLLNMRPGYRWAGPRVWQFNADLHLVDWLVEKGFEFDVISDHDLDAEGEEILRPYRTVLTGSHPEYWSERMLDAAEAYVEDGGRLMYMGGNGFYWVTAFDPLGSGAVEVRRFGGTESWTAEPGELRLAFSGEQGGLWRHRGRAPQRLLGVGFVAQGHDISGFYRRLEPAVRGDADAWVFAGVEGEVIGDFGLAGGGASGMEIDCVSQLLGTPPQTQILASSEGHTDLMLEARDNVGMTFPNMGGVQNPAVRADLTIFELPGGGGVFSTGSIAWCGSLSHNGYENSVSRVTENVLRRFSGVQPA